MAFLTHANSGSAPAAALPPTPTPLPQVGPPWRVLVALAALVLLAHALALRTPISQFGPVLEPASDRAPAFLTRRIELPPAPAPTPDQPPAPAARPTPKKPAKKPILKKKEAVAQAQPTQAAMDSIAPPDLAPPTDSPPPASSHAAQPDDTRAAPQADASAPAPESAPAPAPTPAPAADAGADSDPEAAAAPPPKAPASAAAPALTPVTAMALPPSVQLDYKLTGNAKGLTYYAQGELVWLREGSHYDARMSVHALFIGTRTLASQGEVSAQGLAPSRFSDKYKTEVAAHFEPDKGQISFSANTPSVPWMKGAQDRVSLLLQLGGMLAGNPASYPAGTTLTMYTVGPRDADIWTFRVVGPELLQQPFGELMTLKLVRQPRREFDQTVELWYAPSLGYLPVRSKITQSNGDFVDQQLISVHKP